MAILRIKIHDLVFNKYIRKKIAFGLLLDYARVSNKWCDPHIGQSQNTFLKAKDLCGSNKDCLMFYDVQSKNETFLFCGPSSIPKTSDVLASTLYMKCKNHKHDTFQP